MLACSRLLAVGDEQNKRQARGKTRTEMALILTSVPTHFFPAIPLLLAIKCLEQAILMHSSSKAFGYKSWEGHFHLKRLGMLVRKFELNPLSRLICLWPKLYLTSLKETTRLPAAV